jgi:hypothetical protein
MKNNNPALENLMLEEKMDHREEDQPKQKMANLFFN